MSYGPGMTHVPASTPFTLPGFDTVLGAEYREVSGDRVVVGYAVAPQLLQPYGIVHGGVHCAVVEGAASVGAATWFGERGRVVGVSNQTDFLRAVTEGSLTGVATPIHRGRSQQLWQVLITDERERLVARGQVRLQNLPATPDQ
jgi:1,4-dihydroxy-2-naphthoyl-CoA hydrolase